MKQRSGSRVLIWALAISIALHVAFAVAMRTMHRVEAAPEQQPTHIRIIDRLRTPPPTPAPTPPARPHEARPTAPHVHVNLPRASANAGTAHGHAVSVATSGPDVPGDPNAADGTPAPPPRPVCSTPDAPARALSAAMPETPDDATGLPATAEVRVTLDAQGHVTATEIYRSTGQLALDRAALSAARNSTYAPALAACQAVGGSYLFRVDFAE